MAEVKDAPLTEDELAEFETDARGDAMVEDVPGVMPRIRAADVLRLVAEVRRLRADASSLADYGVGSDAYCNACGRTVISGPHTAECLVAKYERPDKG